MKEPRAARATSLDAGWEFAAQSWLDGDDKTKKLGFSQLSWLPAQVPGHVHLDLVRHGIILDPFVKMGELGAQWVDEAAWSYRRQFDYRKSDGSVRQVIVFDGLDTVCRVFLNGERVAEHDNMFLPLELDVTGKLREGQNDLRVDFDSAPRVGRERRSRFLAEEGMPDDVSRFDERAFVRKAQYMFAWDWGPRLASAGIWRSVRLVEFSSRLVDVRVRQTHEPASGKVTLRIDSEIEGEGRVLHRVEGVSGWVADGQSVEVDDPALWWPSGMGDQKLYSVESYLVDAALDPGRAASDPQALAAATLDQRSCRVGLRTLRLLRERDEQGESFEFEVNGRRLWAVGANWIPDHSFPSIVDRARLREQLLRAVDMNMNMLRIWGGGVYESDDFYDLCDELGLLVWQDFPFACSYVPDGEAEQAVMRVEARANVRRLRNHPSLALWCGNNENLTMWHSKWGRPLPQPGRYYGENLYDRTLPDAVREHDEGRPYVASSPIGGENANDGDVGDQHYWDVWHGRGDWKHYKDSTGRFASEFGFASAPGHAVWRRVFAGDSEYLARDVRDPLARWHDKTGKGYDTYVSYVELHYPRVRNVEELTYCSQLNQRDALRFGIEHFRRTQGCRGSLIWQLNDCWPVQSWAVLDSDGSYKAAAFELRRLYAPALASLEFEVGDEAARLWTLFDNLPGCVRGEAVLEARRLSDGALLERWARKVERASDERGVSLEASVKGFDAPDTLLYATFAGSETFRLLSEPRDARVEAPRLSAFRHERGVMIETDRPVVDLFLWDEAGELELLDNFVTLPGPGRRLLRARGPFRPLSARSLAGRHPVRC